MYTHINTWSDCIFLVVIIFWIPFYFNPRRHCHPTCKCCLCCLMDWVADLSQSCLDPMRGCDRPIGDHSEPDTCYCHSACRWSVWRLRQAPTAFTPHHGASWYHVLQPKLDLEPFDSHCGSDYRDTDCSTSECTELPSSRKIARPSIEFASRSYPEDAGSRGNPEDC